MSHFVISEQSLPKSRHEAYEFARNEGLIPRPPYCRTKCKGHSSDSEIFSHYYFSETDLGIYRCSKQQQCRPTISVARETWFENSRLSPEKELRVLFGFAYGESYERICVGVGNSEGTISTATIAARMKYCREMVTSAFTSMQTSLPKIGGQGIIVQIDESKFGKRKYNRGRIVEGHWVLGMIAQNSEDLRLVVCPQNKRDASTLGEIIQEHVEVGSVIHTDEWKAYSGLSNYGYIHHTVNHSVEFVAGDGTHTQRIESQWNAAKRYLRGQHVPEDEFADKLCEYLWRRYCRKHSLDPMVELLNAIRREYGDFRVRL